MKQAQEMQSKMQDMQARLAEIEVAGEAGAGMIRVTMNGKGEVKSVKIDPALFSGHPRTSGAHTTVLQLAREAGVELMFTLSQLSYWPAMHLGDAGIEAMRERELAGPAAELLAAFFAQTAEFMRNR